MNQDELREALSYEGRKDLPKPYTGKGCWIWVRAIARTVKSDGTSSYAIVKKDGESMRIIKDFGSSSQIVRIETIHPTLWLKPNEIPRMSTPGEIVHYLATGKVHPETSRSLLSTVGKTQDQIQNDYKKIQQLILETAIYISEREWDIKRKFINRKKWKSRRCR